MITCDSSRTEANAPLRVEVGDLLGYRCRVLLDGEDVTNDCYIADEAAGMVRLAVNEGKAENGATLRKVDRERGEVVKVDRYGRVEILPKPGKEAEFEKAVKRHQRGMGRKSS